MYFIIQIAEKYLLHGVHGPLLLKAMNYPNQSVFTDNPIRAVEFAMEEIQWYMTSQTVLWLPAGNTNMHSFSTPYMGGKLLSATVSLLPIFILLKGVQSGQDIPLTVGDSQHLTAAS
jgi:hypothetical protein